MTNPNRERKGDIKAISALQLNDEQKKAMELVINNQIVVITGMAGTGKSLVCASAALKFIKNKQVDAIYTTRAAIEVGKTLGFMPGDLSEKFDHYTQAFIENLRKCCTDKKDVDSIIEKEQLRPLPIQFIRGKTMDDVLIVEEAQNTTQTEMLAILTRLGKTGKIIINGDNAQKDIKDGFSGLDYALVLADKIEGIEHINLKENHRSGLVGKILAYEYGK